MRTARTITRYLYAPFMLIGLNGLGYYFVVNGWSYAWMALPLAIAVAVAFLAERFSPNYEQWNDSHGDGTANWIHAVVYEISNVNATLLIPVIAWLFPFEGLWPRDLPIIVQLLIAVVFADLGFTLVHYFSHRWPLLWRLHAVHHGVPRLYGLNGLVRHPLHQTLDLLFATGPLALLGMPIDVAVLLGLVVSIQLIVQHSNVDYQLGPLRNHMAIGQLHHLHHVNWGKEGDCNFGLFLTLWDRMLGTFQPEPSRRIQAHDMGVDEVPDFPKTYWQQLLFPFIYQPGAGKQTGLRSQPSAQAALDKTRGLPSDSAAKRGRERPTPAE